LAHSEIAVSPCAGPDALCSMASRACCFYRNDWLNFIIKTDEQEQVMNKPALKYMTLGEYLTREEIAEHKSEYYHGEVFAMAGASLEHNQITSNLGSELSVGLKKTSCRVMITDMRLYIEAKDLITYPDIIVVCEKPKCYEDRRDVITNPLLIVEVLSEATEHYDRGKKFEMYRALPSFQEYLLIDQYRVHVEHFYLDEKKRWILAEYNNPSDILKCHHIDFQIALHEIYRRVEFAPA
jgi:Uma2 family endonuclease